MRAQGRLSTRYQVEVSGWDTGENFFVEKTDLDWSDEYGKKVQLHCAVSKGALVFVRLMYPYGAGQNSPVAYQAERVFPGDTAGLWNVWLVQLAPRVPESYEKVAA